MATKLRVGSVLSRGFAIYFRNFVPFTLLVAVIYLPLLYYAISLMGGEVDEETLAGWTVLTSLGGVALGLLASATVAYGTFQQLRGAQTSIGASIVMGIKRLLPVLGVAILVTGVVFLGLLMFVIPGIGLYCTYWLAVPVAVVEGTSIGGSMSRSDRLTEGNRLRILVIIVLLLATSIGFAVLLQAVFLGGKGLTSTGVKAYVILFLIQSVFMTTLTAVLTAVAYHDLRRSKEGATVEDIASVFD